MINTQHKAKKKNYIIQWKSLIVSTLYKNKIVKQHNLSDQLESDIDSENKNYIQKFVDLSISRLSMTKKIKEEYEK